MSHCEKRAALTLRRAFPGRGGLRAGPGPAPGRGIVRITRGLAAALALVVGVVGVPAALVMLGGNPLPSSLSGHAISRALLRPDDGSIIMNLLTLIGWLAWLIFASSVLVELIGLVSGHRVKIQLPGLGGPQQLAAGLLIAVLAMVVAPPVVPSGGVSTPAAAAAAPVHSAALHPGPTAGPSVPVAASPAPILDAGPAALSGTHGNSIDRKATMHVVESGDDLWSLAERYYGQGRDWRKIANANPHRLSGGPDRLEVGWQLVIPDAADAPRQRGDSVVVAPGDSLSSIAQRAYGSPAHWDDIFEANRAQIGDPDELEPGMRLSLPGEHHREEAHPGQAKQTADREPEKDRSAAPGKPVEPVEGNPPAEPPVTPSAGPSSSPRPAGTASVRAEATERPAEVPDQTAVAAEPGQAAIAVGLASVGGLLAAGLLAGLAGRRRAQLQARPIGRRIRHAPPVAAVAEVVLGHRQRPMSLRTLDLAVRAIAAHALHTATPLPPLVTAKVGADQIELVMGRAVPHPPTGFTVAGRSWLLNAADADYLKSVPGVHEAVRPYPALVGLGQDEDGRDVLVDLESVGLLSLTSDAPEHAAAVLLAMAVELSFSVWADEMTLTLVGSADLPAALGKHNVNRTDDIDGLLERLEQRAALQREHQPEGGFRKNRVDPDLADPWAPDVVLINTELSPDQQRRLREILTAEPPPTMAAVVVGPPTTTGWSYAVRAQPSTADRSGDQDVAGASTALTAELAPLGLTLTPQLITPPAGTAIVDLVAASGSDETTPAPWWRIEVEPPDPPPDNVTYLGQRFGGWGSEAANAGEVGTVSDETVGVIHHPTLQLLGPIELEGATGTLPPRAGKQCLEYCGWLLENPGTTAQGMASALAVAEGTRRSNMSRLRSWLGDSMDGEAHLPDAYTGRITLHPSVSSDWQRLQILTAGGVNRASVEGLRAALDLVRGAPLADAAPGQWHWAEELRTDMISAVRDIGVELANRALVAGDVDLARWAAARALVAAPGDELLMAARIRTEHQAGNTAETERLTLQLASHTRSLGVDLDPATVALLQEVMEGRVRARFA